MKSNMKVFLDGPVFANFKADFDAVLKDTLTFGVPYLAPAFDYKVSGAATQKMDLTGTTEDDFSLKTDAESGDFILNEPERAQICLDDFEIGKR